MVINRRTTRISSIEGGGKEYLMARLGRGRKKSLE